MIDVADGYVVKATVDELVQLMFQEMKDANAGRASVKYVNYKNQGINVKLEVSLIGEDTEEDENDD